jgi:hypothetical protein
VELLRAGMDGGGGGGGVEAGRPAAAAEVSAAAVAEAEAEAAGETETGGTQQNGCMWRCGRGACRAGRRGGEAARG